METNFTPPDILAEENDGYNDNIEGQMYVVKNFYENGGDPDKLSESAKRALEILKKTGSEKDAREALEETPDQSE